MTNPSIQKVSNYNQQYQNFSDKLSQCCRQLAYAEGGLYWFCWKTETIPLLYKFFIVIGLFCILIFFICDSLHYYFGMKNYEKLYDEGVKALQQNPNSNIEAGDVNKKSDWAFTWKINFLKGASFFLVISFWKVITMI